MIFTGKPSYIVYKYTLNNLSYIGSAKGTGTPEQIMNQRAGNCGKNYRQNPRFYEAISKWGWPNIKKKVLAFGIETEYEARAYESAFIIKYNTNNPEFGYNCNTGEGDPELVDAILKNDRKTVDELLSYYHEDKKKNTRRDNEEFVSFIVENNIQGKKRIREWMPIFGITESTLSHYTYESSDRGLGRYNQKFTELWKTPEKLVEGNFEPLF